MNRTCGISAGALPEGSRIGFALLVDIARQRKRKVDRSGRRFSKMRKASIASSRDSWST